MLSHRALHCNWVPASPPWVRRVRKSESFPPKLESCYCASNSFRWIRIFEDKCIFVCDTKVTEKVLSSSQIKRQSASSQTNSSSPSTFAACSLLSRGQVGKHCCCHCVRIPGFKPSPRIYQKLTLHQTQWPGGHLPALPRPPRVWTACQRRSHLADDDWRLQVRSAVSLSLTRPRLLFSAHILTSSPEIER